MNLRVEMKDGSVWEFSAETVADSRARQIADDHVPHVESLGEHNMWQAKYDEVFRETISDVHLLSNWTELYMQYDELGASCIVPPKTFCCDDAVSWKLVP